jgi:aryl carrier-like protein
LPAPDQARPNLSENYVAPRSEVEEILAEVWADSLELERIGIFDNFFVLGGDSIRSVRAVALAKEKGLNLTVQQLFQYQTIDRTIQELGETIFYSETEQETPSDPEELLAHLLDEVEGLSDSEIDALLHEKLQKRPAQETST